MYIGKDEFLNLHAEEVSRVQYKVLWGDPTYKRTVMENMFFNSNGLVKDVVDRVSFKVPVEKMNAFYDAMLKVLGRLNEEEHGIDKRWYDGKIYITLKDARRVGYDRVSTDGKETLEEVVENFLREVQAVAQVLDSGSERMS